MIKLTVLVKRRSDLGVEEFHRMWREHGAMIRDEPAFRTYIRRYEQHHTVPGSRSDYDGMVLQWYDSIDDFYALLGDTAYADKMQPDEARMLDTDALVVFFTDEADVFIP
ncbi:MAG: EthD domain-containing protein [Acidimicrobiales bacterium]